MDWRDIPSLSALRAFEAAARLGSLSAAARELNVTHAAIAAHVRALEGFFSTALLTRARQGMEPTPEGALLARGLSEGFTILAATCRDVADRARTRPLAVTTTPTFAEYWLMPKLSDFWARHPDIAVSITPSGDVADLRRDGYDVAIRYGAGDWPGHEVEQLIEGDYVVVAGPRLAEALPDAELPTLLGQYWLMDGNRAEERTLAQALDLDPTRLQVRTFATNGMVLSAVRAGLGLGLQNRAIAETRPRRRPPARPAPDPRARARLLDRHPPRRRHPRAARLSRLAPPHDLIRGPVGRSGAKPIRVRLRADRIQRAAHRAQGLDAARAGGRHLTGVPLTHGVVQATGHGLRRQRADGTGQREQDMGLEPDGRSVGRIEGGDKAILGRLQVGAHLRHHLSPPPAAPRRAAGQRASPR